MTLSTLSHLLSSQEARDAAPCVAVNGTWMLRRDGSLVPVPDDIDPVFLRSGRAISVANRIVGDCIWSGDLPAMLAAMVAENEGSKRKPHPPWADLLPRNPTGCPTGCPMQTGKPMSMTCFHPQCPRRVT